MQRSEARWRLREEEFQYLTKLQKKLLRWACERVKPGGAVVYATCSIEPIENHEVVQAVLRSTPDLVLQEEIASIPGKPSDGGYCARLVRRNH